MFVVYFYAAKIHPAACRKQISNGTLYKMPFLMYKMRLARQTNHGNTKLTFVG